MIFSHIKLWGLRPAPADFFGSHLTSLSLYTGNSSCDEVIMGITRGHIRKMVGTVPSTHHTLTGQSLTTGSQEPPSVLLGPEGAPEVALGLGMVLSHTTHSRVDTGKLDRD